VVSIYLGTESTIIPVAVGMILAPKKSKVHRRGTKKYGLLTNPRGTAMKEATIEKTADSLMALILFLPYSLLVSLLITLQQILQAMES
jgi:hypothetical protein